MSDHTKRAASSYRDQIEVVLPNDKCSRVIMRTAKKLSEIHQDDGIAATIENKKDNTYEYLHSLQMSIESKESEEGVNANQETPKRNLLSPADSIFANPGTQNPMDGCQWRHLGLSNTDNRYLDWLIL